MRFPEAQKWFSTISIAAVLHSVQSRAQYAPNEPTDGFTVVHSPVDGNITISYKSPPPGTCSTVFSTQRQFTGYVTLPPDVVRPSQGDYTINTFFWFIEARQVPESAPLSIFINGGPGSSSMVGLFGEVGPCEVVEISKTRLGTIARDWGWDRSSSMLFIDQPVQTGFSYDNATRASLNLLDETLLYPPRERPVTQPTYTFLNGTFSSASTMSTANTSDVAAQAVWHFLQGFIATFPEYNPNLRPPATGGGTHLGINLFTESYGGKYGPAIGAFFEQQNTLRQTDPAFANSTLEVRLQSLGIINGWTDLLVQAPYHPRFAYNNTYSIEAINEVQELNAISSYGGAGGCEQLTLSCRSQETAYDPDDGGAVQAVNDACSQAQNVCQQYVAATYASSGRSVYDISQHQLDPFPDNRYLEYLNHRDVQQAIGVTVNYTQTSLTVKNAFQSTGDYARDDGIRDMVELLNAGVRVALIYGDRDYLCNWQGGEAVSFAIAAAAGPAYSGWYSAGYAPIVTNTSYVGGVVREYNLLSFSRVYDAGHLVPAYQPETAFTVFSRVIEGTDISMGNLIDLSAHSTSGDANATYQNSAPPAAGPTCFLRAVNSTCNTDQKNMLANDAGVIINGVLYNSETDWKPPDPSIVAMAGYPGFTPTSATSTAPPDTLTTRPPTHDGHTSRTSLPTGVYTATGVPSVRSSSAKNEATNIKSLGFSKDTPPAAAALIVGLWTYGLV